MNDNDNNVDDDDDAAPSFGYDVTGVPADGAFTSGAAPAETDAAAEWDEQPQPTFLDLGRFVSRDQMHAWMNEWRKMLANGEPQSRIDAWESRLRDKYGRRVVGKRPCTQLRRLYRADAASATPHVSPCHVCNK